MKIVDSVQVSKQKIYLTPLQITIAYTHLLTFFLNGFTELKRTHSYHFFLALKKFFLINIYLQGGAGRSRERGD